MPSWTWNRTMDISNWGVALLIDIVLLCRAAYLLWKKGKSEKGEKKKRERERKGQPEQEKEGEAESENNKRMKESERGIEAGTSLLTVPNEEKRAGIIIKKPH